MGCAAGMCDFCRRVVCRLDMVYHTPHGLRKCVECAKQKSPVSKLPGRTHDDDDHVHHACIRRKLYDELTKWVRCRTDWMPAAKQAFSQHGRGVLLFDESEKQSDGQVPLVYLHSDPEIVNSLPTEVDGHTKVCISVRILDSVIRHAPVMYALRRIVQVID